jgi:muconolactone D-isomerase
MGMLFHVGMTIRIPHEVETERVKQLTAKEHERALDLEKQGKWLHAWRVVGKWANISVFEVESSTELHDILNSLPLYPFMDIEVTALCPMPGKLEEKIL